MNAPLGMMGGKIALGDATGVTELRPAAAIFAEGRVPLTRAARLWKIKQTAASPRRKRGVTVGIHRAGVVNRLQAAFAAEVAAGRTTFVAFTMVFNQALGARADDFEADFLRQRAFAIIRKKSKRYGAPHLIFWTMEADRNRGIHLHALAHAHIEHNAPMRRLVKQGFEAACETAVSAPALKFHTPLGRVAGPKEAAGWLAYCLAGLVPPGAAIGGVRGKNGCMKLQVKPAGISKARQNA